VLPVIAIIGRGNSGKTTLLINIVEELTKRKYRVATVKHTFHKLNYDQPGTDTWKHIRAGSRITILSSADMQYIIKPVTTSQGLDTIIELIDKDCDIVLVEGYKKSDVPKIEVYRKTFSSLLPGINNVVAVASDEPVETPIRQFSLNDSAAITDFIIKDYINISKNELSIYVNNHEIDTNNIDLNKVKKAISMFKSATDEINSQDITSIKLYFKK
jgi:molybdopterin-guanine dinucleotide biosynthesis adapter protein